MIYRVIRSAQNQERSERVWTRQRFMKIDRVDWLDHIAGDLITISQLLIAGEWTVIA